MSNPSPEPSAESLAEAEKVYRALTKDLLIERRIWPTNGKREAVTLIALMVDAAKRSSRREALGQAADLVDAACAKALARQYESPWEDPVKEGVNANIRMMAVLLPDVAAALRALMEAE